MSGDWNVQHLLDTWVGPAFERPPDPMIAPADTTRAESRARRALRWYRPSWREAHGEELVSTILDTLPDSVDRDDRGLGWRTHLDLVRGGLAQRRHARPTLGARYRLFKGTEPLTPEGLAWLRDTLDQRGFCLLDVVQLVAATMPQIILWSTLDWPHRALSTPLVMLGVLVPLAILTLCAMGLTTRRKWIRTAGLDASGWPLIWNPPPPTHRLLVPAPPPRWVVGELRSLLCMAFLAAIASTASAFVTLRGAAQLARQLQMDPASLLGNVPKDVFEFVGIWLILGVVLAVPIGLRARKLCGPGGYARPGMIAREVPANVVIHDLSPTRWPTAILIAIGAAIPFIGWLVGMAALVAIPVIARLLGTVRRIEAETGSAVHHHQIARVFGR